MPIPFKRHHNTPLQLTNLAFCPDGAGWDGPDTRGAAEPGRRTGSRAYMPPAGGKESVAAVRLTMLILLGWSFGPTAAGSIVISAAA